MAIIIMVFFIFIIIRFLNLTWCFVFFIHCFYNIAIICIFLYQLSLLFQLLHIILWNILRIVFTCLFRYNFILVRLIIILYWVLNVNNLIWASRVLRCLKYTYFIWALVFAYLTINSIFRRFVAWITWIISMVWNNRWLSACVCYLFILIFINKFRESWRGLLAFIYSRRHKLNWTICSIVWSLKVKLVGCKFIKYVIAILIFSEIVVHSIMFTWHHMTMATTAV